MIVIVIVMMIIMMIVIIIKQIIMIIIIIIESSNISYVLEHIVGEIAVESPYTQFAIGSFTEVAR